MDNLIVIAVIVLAVGSAAGYVIKARRRGAKCIGCPDGGSCSGHCSACRGGCGCHGDE